MDNKIHSTKTPNTVSSVSASSPAKNATEKEKKEFEDLIESKKTDAKVEKEELPLEELNQQEQEEKGDERGDEKPRPNHDLEELLRGDIKQQKEEKTHYNIYGLDKIEKNITDKEKSNKDKDLDFISNSKNMGEKFLSGVSSEKIQSAPAMKELQPAIEKIINQIRAGVDQLSGKKEVRLILTEANFKGTEVKLLLDGQKLQITFSGQSQQLDWLQHNQMNLQNRLKALNPAQMLELNFQTFKEGTSSENDSNQRSRQYQDVIDKWQEDEI